jgi:hypothetical protein
MAAVRADRAPEPVRCFGTFTTDLHRLVDWFTECGVETVVMESTSVYWIPIFELLDARGFTVFLVNEDVLDLYVEASEPKHPVVCFDDSPTQLIGQFISWAVAQ